MTYWALVNIYCFPLYSFLTNTNHMLITFYTSNKSIIIYIQVNCTFTLVSSFFFCSIDKSSSPLQSLKSAPVPSHPLESLHSQTYGQNPYFLKNFNSFFLSFNRIAPSPERMLLLKTFLKILQLL